MARIEALMSAVLETPEGDELEVLATLVDAYEAKHHAIDAPVPLRPLPVAKPQAPGDRCATIYPGDAEPT